MTQSISLMFKLRVLTLLVSVHLCMQTAAAEEISSSSDKQVSTSTYTLVMRVPGEPGTIFWSLELPESFGIKATRLKENTPTHEGDIESKEKRDSQIIKNKISRLWMNNLRWADLAFNDNYNVGNLKTNSEENIKIYLFLGTYNYLYSFSNTLISRINSMCIQLKVNKNGLISLENDPARVKYNPTTGLIKDLGSCGVRTDGKSSKFIRRTALGGYDLEIDCWSNVSPGICKASSSFKGWPIRFAFPASLLNRHTDLLNLVNEFLNVHTDNITTATHIRK